MSATMPDPQMAPVSRARRLSEQLMASSMNTSGVRAGAPMSVAAPIAQALAAALSGYSADRREEALNDRRAAGRLAFDQKYGLTGGSLEAPPAAPPPPLPASPPTATGGPAVAARGDAPQFVAQGIADRRALDPNSPTYVEDLQKINNGVVGQTPDIRNLRPQPVAAEARAPGATPLASSLGVSAPPTTPLASRLSVPTPERLMAAYGAASASDDPALRARAPQFLQMAQFAALQARSERDDVRADRSETRQAESAAADRAFRERSLQLQAQGLSQQQAHQQAMLELQRGQLARAGLPQGYEPAPGGGARPIAGVPQAPPPGTPAGYRPGPDGSLAPIPGGPADPSRNGGPYQGTSGDSQDLNILHSPQADPSSPVYEGAYLRQYGPRTEIRNGEVVTIQPPIPQGIRPPVPRGVSGPPAARAAPAAPAPSAPPPSGALIPQGNVQPPASTTPTPGGGSVTRSGQGPLSESQSRSNMFGNAMVEGERILRDIQIPSDAAILAWRNLPESASNMGLSRNDQQYFNAVRQFAAGILRKETGAAFTAQELLDVQSRFFPSFRDDPATVAQKARARQQAIESMRAEIPGGFRGQLPSPGGSSGGAAPALPPGFRIVQ